LTRARYPPPPAWAADFATAGVTGTNGKTTTTTMLWAALQRHRSPAGAITTVGSRVGERSLEPIAGHRDFLEVAAALHREGGRHLALELTSVALAQGIMGAWPVRVGVFTNLSRDHDDQHSSPEHYLASKAQLFVHLPAGGTAVLNASDPTAALLREVVPPAVSVKTYGAPWRGAVPVDVDLHLEDPRVGLDGSEASLAGPLAAAFGHAGGAPRLRVRGCGLHFLENGAAALLGATALGVSPGTALAAVAEVAPPPGRFEIVGEAPRVIVDYAHTPDALRRTVQAARAITRGELWVVFGAGGNRSRDKRLPLGAAAAQAEHVVITNDNPRDEDPARIAQDVAKGLDGHGSVHVELDRAEAIEFAIVRAADDDVVVVAGKGHEAEQMIDGQVRAFSDREVAARCLAARARD